ncbi:MAG TPA: hypothetical protein VNH18_16580, partial [Bryobacteraceae bacterium]|nr:hypothetical protein [Bryobacteraceae bacterium]
GLARLTRPNHHSLGYVASFSGSLPAGLGTRDWMQRRDKPSVPGHGHPASPIEKVVETMKPRS